MALDRCGAIYALYKIVGEKVIYKHPNERRQSDQQTLNEIGVIWQDAFSLLASPPSHGEFVLMLLHWMDMLADNREVFLLIN
jgi:hypothetical protein